MSFFGRSWLEAYARWREDYLRAHPEKRLFSWIFGGLESIPAPEEPIITVDPEIKKRGIWVVVLLGLVLALGGTD